MSRMQQIIEKAEREGAMRRMRAAEGAALADIAPVGLASASPISLPASAATSMPTAVPIAPELGAAAATAVPAPAQTRVIETARLDPRLISVTAADSIGAEQYRALRTRLFHSDNGSIVNVVLVTSPGRSEGKTLTAGNLGLTMAQEHQRHVCLVDADMRNPELHHIFGVPAGPGLSEVLAGTATLDDALVTIEQHHITLLTAGQARTHPADLLGTTAMRRTLETLRSRFDRVILDAPSTSPLADVGVLTPLVDGVVLVVRSGVTSKPSIHDAIGSIDPSKLLGVVLNEAA
jgi:capsular exopolysaccharide synthesis family protein